MWIKILRKIKINKQHPFDGRIRIYGESMWIYRVVLNYPQEYYIFTSTSFFLFCSYL